ncbi:lipopolysaccharide assembly protein LapA domain-containing protein [Microvirga sp. 2MCAF38]|uniref:lipopolysaccharide assembly protein LapA domain-containing protein n=1 Tax=Microvirga sp. 2MCAF38 TaxID=3232989 RepID=UPI003F9A2F0B
MIRFLKALILLPIALAVVLLAVANRGSVMLSLDPFTEGAPEFAVQLPLFVVIFAATALGVLIGGMATWLAQGKHRRARREARREANHLRGETERLRAQIPVANVPAVPPSRTSFL